MPRPLWLNCLPLFCLQLLSLISDGDGGDILQDYFPKTQTWFDKHFDTGILNGCMAANE